MNNASVHTVAAAGGICGVAGTLCYFFAVFVPMPDTLSYALVMLWPLLSIVLCYAIFRLIGSTREGAFNSLGFVFACLAFVTVASMISIQLAVRMGIAEYSASAGDADRALFAAILKSVRMVDLGMDVAWDFFIGTYMVMVSVALSGDPRFGKVWGAITGVLGAALVVLNVITFPWPPNTRDLFDLGPFIAMFIIALSIRLTMIGLKGRRVGAA